MGVIRMIIKKKDGTIIIPKSYYDDTSDDFCGKFEGNQNECLEKYDGDWDRYIKECPSIGKRTWMPPISLFGQTCLIVESDKFKIIYDDEFIGILNGGTYQCSFDGVTTIFREV